MSVATPESEEEAARIPRTTLLHSKSVEQSEQTRARDNYDPAAAPAADERILGYDPVTAPI